MYICLLCTCKLGKLTVTFKNTWANLWLYPVLEHIIVKLLRIFNKVLQPLIVYSNYKKTGYPHLKHLSSHDKIVFQR